MSVIVGLDRMTSEGASKLAACRLGLVTHGAAVNAELRDAVEVLLGAGFHLRALFSPEHGLSGAISDGAAVADGTDARSGLPVYSLYGETVQPSVAALADLDALLFDMQDVGVRFYTFTSTLYYVLRGAAEAGIPVIVLDRPNPLGGVTLEGPVLDPAFLSFVGIVPIPVRYGLTIGELARTMNVTVGADLTVVPLAGWRREMAFDGTGLQWVPTSPAMPHLSTVFLYPGMCFLEGTNLSEGRGTPLPFEICGAPWIDGYELAAKLNALTMPGVRFRPCQFVPALGTRYGAMLCGGVQVHVLDSSLCRPVTVGLQLIAAVKSLWPENFAWRERGGKGSHFHFDLLLGTDRVREALNAGEDIEALVQSWAGGLETFAEACRPYLLYT